MLEAMVAPDYTNVALPAPNTADSIADILLDQVKPVLPGSVGAAASDVSASESIITGVLGVPVGANLSADIAANATSLGVIEDKVDALPTSSGAESATYTADGAITVGDLVGVTSAGKATKLTPDWAASAVPVALTTLAVSGGYALHSHSAWIATDKFITVYNNNTDIYVVVSTIAANGTITPGTPVDSTYNSTAYTDPVRVVKLDTDKAQIFFQKTTDTNYGHGAVVTVSGTVPTIAASSNFSGTDVPTSMDACQLSTDKSAVSWKITGEVFYHIKGCTVSGTTQTWGTVANSGNTSTGNTDQSSIAKVATDLVAWFYIRSSANLWVANVSFSGANATRNGTDVQILSLATYVGDANGELTSCSPATNLAFVATVNSSDKFVYVQTATVSGTASPVIGVGTDITFQPNPGNNVGAVSCQVLDSTHIAVNCQSNYLKFMGVLEVASVNLVRTLYVGKVADGFIYEYPITLLIQANGKSIEIGLGDYAIVARPYTIYRKGLSTYADTVPTPVYGFLGVALESIADTLTGSIGLKGTFTGYASGLNVLKKYVRGTNEYTFLKTVNKDYPYGEVLANVMSATAIEIMIPPGTSVNTDNYWAFEYQPSLSGNGPWLNLTVAALDVWTAWTSYLVPGNIDRFIEGLSYMCRPMNTADEYIDAVQIGYGSTTVNVTLLASVPFGYESLTAAGLYPAIIMPLNRLRVPTGQTIYIRHCRYDGDITSEYVKLALTLSQLE